MHPRDIRRPTGSGMGWTNPYFARNPAGSRPYPSIFVDQHGEAGHGIRDVFYCAHDDFLGRSAVVGGTTIAGALFAVCLGLVGAIVHTKPGQANCPLDGFSHISGHGVRGVSVGHLHVPANVRSRRRHWASIGLSFLGFPNLLGNVAI